MNKCFIFLTLLTSFLVINLAAINAQTDYNPIIDSLRKELVTDPQSVLGKVDSFLNKAKAQGDSFAVAKLLDAKGLANRNAGNYDQAINNHQQAYEIYSKLGNQRSIAGSLNSIGIVLQRTLQYDKAIGYYNKALLLIQPSDSLMLNILYTNIGVCYDYSDKQPQAIEMYKKAEVYIKPGDFYSLGVSNLNIGVCYDMLDNFKTAEQYFLKALEFQQKTDSKDLLARIGISLGQMYLNHKMLNKAIYYFEMGGKAADESNAVELLENYYDNIIPLYIEKGDAKKALYCTDKLNELRKKMYSNQNSKNIAIAETKFNVALKNKEIENLKISQSLAELKVEKQRQLRNVLIGCIALALLLLFIVYRNYQLRKNNFKLLAREKELVDRENAVLEKNNELLQNENMLARFEILKSQVSPHFLFNTLNALSYLIESDAEKAIRFSTAFSKLYRTILEIKDKHLIHLYEELNHVEDYFFLQLTRFGESLKIEKNIAQQSLELMLPPFSIQIAVENAINHNVVSQSHPLYIYIYTEGDELVISNNLQLKNNSIKSTSIGIANIKSRYSFFTEKQPEFIQTESHYVVKLPLLPKQ